MLKKFFAIFIVLIVFLSVSCAEPAAEESFSVDFDAENGILDMKGMQFNIIQGYDETILFQYKADTLPYDLVKKRFKEIEDKYNCELTIGNVPGGDYLDGIATQLMAGEYFGEIAFSAMPYLLTHSGFLYPLDGLEEYIDYLDPEKYGNLEMRAFSVNDGSIFTVCPIRWAGKQTSYSYAFFAVNEQIIKKNVLTDPREFVENGTWYWDKFEEILPQYTFGTGDEKVTAVNFGGGFPLDFASSNGYAYVDEALSADNFRSPAVAEALDFLSRICVEYQDNISYDGHFEMVPNFIAQKYVLAQTSFAHMINEIIYDVDDYGVVPVPCGPRGQYGKWGGFVAGYDSFGIFYNAKEPESSAIILSDLLEPLEGYETKDDLLNYAKTIFYDDADAELFLSYINNIHYDYWKEGIYAIWSETIPMLRNGQSSSEIIGKYEDSIRNLIEENVLSDYEYIYANKK